MNAIWMQSECKLIDKVLIGDVDEIHPAFKHVRNGRLELDNCLIIYEDLCQY